MLMLMFVCIVPLSQPSSRDLLYVNVNVCIVPLSQPSSRDLLYVNVNVCVHCPVVSTQ